MSHLVDVLELEGLLGEDEVRLLYERAKESKYPIVEIGSYRGKSTCALALGSREGKNVPVYAIDPHEPEPYGAQDRAVMLKNIVEMGFADLVRVIDLPSRFTPGFDEDWKLRIGLLWIDGDHEDAVYDWLAWSGRVVRGGWALLHDRHHLQVQKALTLDRYYRRHEDVGGIAQLQRKAR